jgi:hypothetical protein
VTGAHMPAAHMSAHVAAAETASAVVHVCPLAHATGDVNNDITGIPRQPGA